MGIDLDTLIATEQGQRDALDKDISKGLSAQIGLAQKDALLADLSAIAQRRKDVVNSAEVSLKAATAAAADVTLGLSAIDAFLTKLPGTLKLSDLDALIAADLPAPPFQAKQKYSDYVDAQAKASAAVLTATTALTQARLDEARARVTIDRADLALKASVDVAVTAAALAKAALTDGLNARSASDLAAAYFAEVRAKDFVAVVSATATAVTSAEAALVTAVDSAADATNVRLTAEADLTAKQAARTAAGDQLGNATAHVLKQLRDAVKKAQP